MPIDLSGEQLARVRRIGALGPEASEARDMIDRLAAVFAEAEIEAEAARKQVREDRAEAIALQWACYEEEEAAGLEEKRRVEPSTQQEEAQARAVGSIMTTVGQMIRAEGDMMRREARAARPSRI